MVTEAVSVILRARRQVQYLGQASDTTRDSILATSTERADPSDTGLGHMRFMVDIVALWHFSEDFISLANSHYRNYHARLPSFGAGTIGPRVADVLSVLSLSRTLRIK
jgi:hypothetical protein